MENMSEALLAMNPASTTIAMAALSCDSIVFYSAANAAITLPITVSKVVITNITMPGINEFAISPIALPIGTTIVTLLWMDSIDNLTPYEITAVLTSTTLKLTMYSDSQRCTCIVYCYK